MNRYIVDNKLRLYYRSIDIAKQKHLGSSIIEDSDTEYLIFIDKITRMSNKVDEFIRKDVVYEVYSYENSEGSFEIFLLRDTEDNKYFDYLEYSFQPIFSVMVSYLKTMSTPKEFYNKFFVELEYTVVCFSELGACKRIRKIPELRGIKQIGSAYLVFSKNRKVSNPIYIKGDDVYIDCGDYFSPTFEEIYGIEPDDVGTPLNYRLIKYYGKDVPSRFVYEDNWSSIVLKRSAWLRFGNFIRVLDILDDVKLSQLCCSKIAKYHNWTKPIDVVYKDMLYDVCRIVRSKIKDGY